MTVSPWVSASKVGIASPMSRSPATGHPVTRCATPRSIPSPFGTAPARWTVRCLECARQTAGGVSQRRPIRAMKTPASPCAIPPTRLCHSGIAARSRHRTVMSWVDVDRRAGGASPRMSRDVRWIRAVQFASSPIIPSHNRTAPRQTAKSWVDVDQQADGVSPRMSRDVRWTRAVQFASSPIIPCRSRTVLRQIVSRWAGAARTAVGVSPRMSRGVR